MDLSVIIPVCNTQNHIAACLRSVTRCPKEHIDMECIVINSTDADETAAVVNRYIERDSRIRLAIEEGKDVSKVRNKGIETAMGRYLIFLDADDRLCEDAWEQIEAAVEEEYADFVAFSHITLDGNGKFKAQMLPISDVISTDDKEARRLMYADSVLKTYRGKLFKSRIIRDNNIFFPADLPLEADFFFVTEYFEHCESFLMTKAMILYCPQKSMDLMKDEIMKDYGMEVRLNRIWVLHDHSVKSVKRYHDEELVHCVQVFFFRVVTSLFCEYVQKYNYSKNALETIYGTALEHKFLRSFLDEVGEHEFHSKVLRYEYRLLRKGNTAKIRRYFSIKARLHGVKDAQRL